MKEVVLGPGVAQFKASSRRWSNFSWKSCFLFRKCSTNFYPL